MSSFDHRDHVLDVIEQLARLVQQPNPKLNKFEVILIDAHPENDGESIRDILKCRCHPTFFANEPRILFLQSCCGEQPLSAKKGRTLH
jgi:hypothetical protein